MKRLVAPAFLALWAVGTLSAGMIPITAYNGSGIPTGLTSAYVSGTSTSCVGYTLLGNTCITGSAGSANERNYDTGLFQYANTSGSYPQPYSGYSSTTMGVQTSGGTMTDGPIVFDMLSDSTFGATTPNSQDYWGNGTAGSTMTIPVGVQEVTDVYTMLNNIYGVAGQQDTVVYLNFGTSSNVAIAGDQIEIDLTNSAAGTGASASGQIRDSVLCSAAGASHNSNGVYCNGLDTGPTAVSSTPLTKIGGTTQVTGITVATNTVYSTPYSGDTLGNAVYLGTSGTLDLIAQDFEISSLVGAGLAAQFESLYLVDIQIKEQTGSAGVSSTALSGITVESLIPEPSSVYLLLGGLGAIAFLMRRRLQNQ